ncbi:MAG: hypothetical protein ACMXYK_00930 [Candidatus Woesearchaeota archaeon]
MKTEKKSSYQTSSTTTMHDSSKVQDLIYLADINFLICQKIYESLPSDRCKANKFLLLSANNAFNEAIGILHTLLCSNKKEELTIKPILEEIINKEKSINVSIEDEKIDEFTKKILEDYPSPNYCSYTFFLDNDQKHIGDILKKIRQKKRQSGLKQLEQIKNKFEKNNFHKIRHQTTAHKNKHLSDPAGANHLYLKDGHIQNLREIIKELRISSYFWFDFELQNPNYQTIHDLEKFKKILRNNYDKQSVTN